MLGFSSRAQGEIFGIALVFVILVLGIVIFSQIQTLSPKEQVDIVQDEKYDIISEGSLNSILKLSSGCYVERNRDSVRDLINFCLENSFSGFDPDIECKIDGSFEIKSACSYSLELINNSLKSIFTVGNVARIPYDLIVDVPRNDDSLLNLKNIEPLNNFGNFTFNDELLTSENYRKFGLKRVSSGLKTWPTAQGNIEFELRLYYS